MSQRTFLWTLAATVFGGCLYGPTTTRPPDMVIIEDLSPEADLTGPDLACTAGLTNCGGLCLDTTMDVDHCGGCATVCAAGQVCTGGACSLFCPTGQTNCNGSCFNLLTDNSHCGMCGTTCAGGTSCAAGTCACPTLNPDTCKGVCTNLLKDSVNCGACGTACAATEMCSAGKCVSGCGNGQTGCPATKPTYCALLDSDGANCGACGAVCNNDTDVGKACTLASDCSSLNCVAGSCIAGKRVCSSGKCINVCTGALTLCGSDCVDIKNDPANCGSCGSACASGQACSAGVCTALCASPLMVCSGVCLDVRFDPDHCGTCTNACPTTGHVATRGCAAGTCSIVKCATGYLDCNAKVSDGCEVDSTSDAMNCGACGKACGSGANCVAGACGCPTGMMSCGGTCVPLPVDEWKWDGNATDGVGGHNGTPSQITFAAGKFGQAASFNGSTSSIVFDATVGNWLTNDYTMEWWVNETSTLQIDLLNKRPICGGGNFWDVRSGNTGIVGTEQLGIAFNGTTAINDGKWHQIAYTRQGTKLTLYIDGKAEASGTASASFSVNNGTAMNFGYGPCVYQDPTTPYKGLLDEMRFFNSALTSDQMAALNATGICQ